MAPTRLCRLACWMLAAAVWASCANPEAGDRSATASSPRLVLLYASCTVATTHLSPYSPEVEVTPRLQAFANESLVFLRHQTEAGQSGTAFASIFTGTQAPHHGVFHHPTRLAPRVDALGEVFARAGFHVEMWLGHVMASASLGYGQGAKPSDLHDRLLVADDPAFLEILEHLRDDSDTRALVVSSFTITHGAYLRNAVEPFCAEYPRKCGIYRENPRAFEAAVRFYTDHEGELAKDFPETARRYGLSGSRLEYLARVVDFLYTANVVRLDQQFGQILDVINEHGLADDSLVVFTADHGETLFREGAIFHWSHGFQLAPEVLQVPWIARGPGIEPGRYPGVSRSIDVLPTLATWAGIDGPRLPKRSAPDDPTIGTDVTGCITCGSSDDSQVGERPLAAWSHTGVVNDVVTEKSRGWEHFQTYFPDDDPRRMWVQARVGDAVHQIRIPPSNAGGEIEKQPRVFDLAADPRQLEDLYRADDPNHALWQQRLEAYRQRLIEAFERLGASDLEDERQIELLRSLGYIE